ncbi:hypothetical protein CH63R_08171 [Colletotrichum higginsianum IMI 349063]|uniref:CCHC-type domain-containing protein n=3 Tax=Colletotrichum higginsianum TaxID=80884 RepID=A0A1B7YBF1_COLHI|nr:hypothetical protein CH63R_08171 [Colletotrichum higginsianum IMI 349063]OBR09406.1 hypothetical protein CH63R_08171 [Colletotrichum higginsianum IMI 349063]
MPRESSKGDPRITFKKVHSLNRIGDRAPTRTQRQLAANVEPKKHSQHLPVHIHVHKSKQPEGKRDDTLPGGDGVGGTASSQVTPFWGIVSPPRSSPPFHFEITLSGRDADFVVTNGRESLEGSLESARCGSCGHFGHRLIDCIFMDKNGFVSGCPLCNDKRHRWDDCKRKHELSERDVYHVVVQRRGNKPAIASSQPWIQLVARAQLKMFRVRGSTTGPFPWTAKLAQSIRNGNFRTKKSVMPVLFHVWYNYRDDEGSGPRNRFLVSDPVTSSLRAVGVNAKRLMKLEVCSPQS